MKYTSAWVKQRTAKDGKKTWYGYLKYMGADGKPKQTAKAFDRSKVKGVRQAEKALQEWRQEMEATSSVTSCKTYTTAYVMHHLDNLALNEDQRTIAAKKATAKKHLGRFDKVPIGKLSTSEVQDWVKYLNSEGYKPRTVDYIFGILRSACIRAVKVGDIARNPCAGVELPKVPAPKPNGLEPQDMADLLDLLDAEGPTRLATAAYIAVLAGLRVGEVCALTWADFDGENLSVSKSIANDGGGSLREKTPKTDAGEREVPVPPRLRDALKLRKQYQLDRIEEAGIGVSIDGVHIVGGCDGSTMNPSAMSARWRKFARRNGIKGASGRRATFHDLRDSFGTALLAAGVDVKTSASLMGHGDDGVTLLRHYATATRHAKSLAAQKLAKSLDAAS